MRKRWVGCLILALPVVLQAGHRLDLASVQLRAKHFVEKRLVEQFGGKIAVQTERVKNSPIAPCSRALSFFLPGAALQSRMAVGVRCEAGTQQGWTLFVPVAIQLKKRVVVATRDLPKDVAIQMRDVVLQERDTIPLRQGYFETLAPVLGQTTQTTIAAGAPMTPRVLRQAVVNKRGQSFRIMAHLNLEHKMVVTTHSVAWNAHFWSILNEKTPQNAHIPDVCCAFSSFVHSTLPQNWTFLYHSGIGGE